jgi:CheY-like chemotaxis protein
MGSMKNSNRQHPTILVVEDDDWTRAGMKNAVEQEGYRAVEARNDAEALQLAQREPPDLILTEEELPTFAALMARLREHPTLSSVPVVIVNPDAENGARYGDAYLLADYADITSFLAVLRY